MTKDFTDWIVGRLREPSTYAGLAAVLAGTFHAKYATAEADIISNLGMALGGLMAIVLAEKAGDTKK